MSDEVNETIGALEAKIKGLENPWISVDDRLPEKGTDCLVYIGDRQSVILTTFLDDFALVRVSPTDGFAGHGVTHWQPVIHPGN